MNDTTIRTASCGCGALTVAVTGAPKRAMLCSCRACQSRTGTAVSISAYWDETDVEISGPSTAWQRACQDDRQAEQHFCPTCGTTLWWRMDFAQGQIGVAGGAFEDADFLTPTAAYWASRRPAWVAGMHDIDTLDRQGS